jgi:D-alanyl-D-alanine carboxypeptidase
MAPGVIMTITLDNRRLFTQLANQRPVEIFAESESRFFSRASNAQITFTRDAAGVVTGLVLHQSGGRADPGRKLPPTSTPP